MKHILFVTFLFAIFGSFATIVEATTAPILPCSLVLEPVHKQDRNAKGVALLYKVKLTPSFPRTSISVHALHLPEPSSFGKYDTYEGFAFIKNEISWRFKLYPTPELDSPTWAGRFDDITAIMKGAEVQVRPSNSKIEKLGPPILSNPINKCK
ncbi:hypothetical protein KHA93_21460 [Bacillus sp. FJAT-49732]|uniref:Uncharacterized protein n=1 Tax=Lederbergia citrisecunda TaxID=2833583 RepID=A0A942TPJ8_9BACI|nr:hypothetical protein [Lederbergia citrisecunda]MBS4202181.1 hypothetical protein [Lederbergia citrisecunda]